MKWIKNLSKYKRLTNKICITKVLNDEHYSDIAMYDLLDKEYHSKDDWYYYW